MTILDIKYYYNGVYDPVESLVDLYRKKLHLDKNFIFITYIRRKDLINRTLRPGDELRLVELDPCDVRNTPIKDFSEKLQMVREKIRIDVTYKDIYGKKRTQNRCVASEYSKEWQCPL